MHYRVREVIPPLRNATDQVNELYRAHVDDELVPVRGQADALDFENNVQSFKKPTSFGEQGRGNIYQQYGSAKKIQKERSQTNIE